MTNIGGELLGSFMPGSGGEEEGVFNGAHGQSQALIKQTYFGLGQTQGNIHRFEGYGQAQAVIFTPSFGYGQAQATIIHAVTTYKDNVLALSPQGYWELDEFGG